MIATVQIGNTDNKLTQQEWSSFVHEVGLLLSLEVKCMHFFGGSSNWEKWQNTAWIFEIEDNKINNLKFALQTLKIKYKQDSIAWTQGEIEFIK